ncbi:MAG: PAS domain-containing protein [Candidatus Nealsonbacteria bacterium]|nr:PAS domain-containing protein [Candidatus Nealsonbacteria bacterium]
MINFQKIKTAKATLAAVVALLEEPVKTKDEIEAILNSIGDGICVINLNKEIIFFNEAMEEIIGWQREEALGNSCYNVLRLTDETGQKNICRDGCPLFELLKYGRVVPLGKPYCITHKSGKIVPVADSMALVKSEKGETIGAVYVFSDDTQRRKREKISNDFISIASHQLKTPLISVRWFIELLMEGKTGELNKTQKDYLLQIYKSNFKLIKLVDGLLNISRLESGRVGVLSELTCIEDLIGEAVGEMESRAKMKKVRLVFEKPAKLTSIMADARLLKQIIENLIGNAIDYNKENGSVIVTIKVGSKDATIAIADTGVGISKEQRKKIFGKFFRGETAARVNPEGSGLGLYIVQIMLDLCGGKIWFESEEGRGTTFYVSIPRQ